MTETKVKSSPQMTEEIDNLRNSTAVLKSYLEDLDLLFQSIERSPDRPERELLQTSFTWSQLSSPLEVVFQSQTDESSCSNTSQLSVGQSESSIFEEESETEDDRKEEGYEADTSDLLEEENADD